MRKTDYGYGLKFQFFGGGEGGGGGFGGLLPFLGGLGGLFGFGGGSSSSSGSNNLNGGFNLNPNNGPLQGGVSQNQLLPGININESPIISDPNANTRSGGGFRLFGGIETSSSLADANSNVNRNTNVAQANPNNMQTMISQTFNPNQNAGLAAQSPAFQGIPFNPTPEPPIGSITPMMPPALQGYAGQSVAIPPPQPMPRPEGGGGGGMMPFGGGFGPPPNALMPPAQQALSGGEGGGTDLNGALARVLAERSTEAGRQPASAPMNYSGNAPPGAASYMPPSAGLGAAPMAAFGAGGQMGGTALPIVGENAAGPKAPIWAALAQGATKEEPHAVAKARPAEKKVTTPGAPHKGQVSRTEKVTVPKPPPTSPGAFTREELGGLQKQEGKMAEPEMPKPIQLTGVDPAKEFTQLLQSQPQRSAQITRALDALQRDQDSAKEETDNEFKERQDKADHYLDHARNRLDKVDEKATLGQTPEDTAKIMQDARDAVLNRPGDKEFLAAYNKGAFSLGASRRRNTDHPYFQMALGMTGAFLAGGTAGISGRSRLDNYLERQERLDERQAAQMRATQANKRYADLMKEAEDNAKNAAIATRQDLSLQYKAAAKQVSLGQADRKLVDVDYNKELDRKLLQSVNRFKAAMSAVTHEQNENKEQVTALRDVFASSAEQMANKIRERQAENGKLRATAEQDRAEAYTDHVAFERDLLAPRRAELEADAASKMGKVGGITRNAAGVPLRPPKMSEEDYRKGLLKLIQAGRISRQDAEDAMDEQAFAASE